MERHRRRGVPHLGADRADHRAGPGRSAVVRARPRPDRPQYPTSAARPGLRRRDGELPALRRPRDGRIPGHRGRVRHSHRSHRPAGQNRDLDHHRGAALPVPARADDRLADRLRSRRLCHQRLDAGRRVRPLEPVQHPRNGGRRRGVPSADHLPVLPVRAAVRRCHARGCGARCGPATVAPVQPHHPAAAHTGPDHFGRPQPGDAARGPVDPAHSRPAGQYRAPHELHLHPRLRGLEPRLRAGRVLGPDPGHDGDRARLAAAISRCASRSASSPWEASTAVRNCSSSVPGAGRFSPPP